MKKILLTIGILMSFCSAIYAATEADALTFFKNYVKLANNYSDDVTKLYAPNAKIIRQVIKPDGTTADAITNSATYVKQLKIGQAGAKLRGYKNSYSNVKVQKINDNKFKISSVRQPIGDNDKLKTYMIIQKQSNGNWLIVEELMQTRQQIFLRYVK